MAYKVYMYKLNIKSKAQVLQYNIPKQTFYFVTFLIKFKLDLLYFTYELIAFLSTCKTSQTTSKTRNEMSLSNL